MRGTVKAFIGDRGFGFLRPDEAGRDLFFHIKEFEPRDAEPMVGDAVEFELGTDQKSGREQAKNVRLI